MILSAEGQYLRPLNSRHPQPLVMQVAVVTD
jgi:hypothetical protein